MLRKEQDNTGHIITREPLKNCLLHKLQADCVQGPLSRPNVLAFGEGALESKSTF